MLNAVKTYQDTDSEYEAKLQKIGQLTDEYNRLSSTDPDNAAAVYKELTQLHAEAQRLHSKLTGIRAGLSDVPAALS